MKMHVKKESNLEQKLERKESVIFKLEVEISKLKFRLLKSRPELRITNVAKQNITPAFFNSPNPNSKNKKFDNSNETTEENTVNSF